MDEKTQITLLRAAQEVVNEAVPEMRRDESGRHDVYVVDGEVLDALKAIVRQINDDAVRVIEEQMRQIATGKEA